MKEQYRVETSDEENSILRHLSGPLHFILLHKSLIAGCVLHWIDFEDIYCFPSVIYHQAQKVVPNSILSSYHIV